MQETSPSHAPSAPAPDCRLVCLTGFMGSGKSTAGRLLAAQLAWHFIDLDSEIEMAAGLSIPQIFEQKGEAAFRDIEHACLARIIGQAAERDQRLVLALGGGTFVQPRNAALVREFNSPQRRSAAVVIWLDCPIEDLLKRCVLMGGRPLFRDEASFRKLYLERLPFYQQADYRVESGAEPIRVVEQLLALGIFGRSAGDHASGDATGAAII